jgi:type II secretory pathway predicted ATPase ExeA/septal ring-binding cell division protein DamX
VYYEHFGLKQAPFKITPNTDFFFAGANRGAILEALVYAINNGEGIIKVVGEVGSGKTMLSRMLQTRLPDKVECVYLANPSIAPEDVVFAIAFELQLKLPQNMDRLQALQLLQKYLLDRHAEGKQVVIFVEEAQGMPIATLEEIRLLTNLETKQDKLLQIVLFGQPELDTNLNATQIRQLRERITHSFNLDPIDQNAIRDYLMFRLRSAGYFGPPIFTEAAIKLLTQSSQGLVRRVNVLADKAMLATFAQNLYLVDVKQVEAAIRDSEFGAEQIKRKAKINIGIGVIAFVAIFAVVGLTIYQGFWQGLFYPVPARPMIAKSAQAAKLIAKPADQDTQIQAANKTQVQTSPSEVVTASNTSAAISEIKPVTQTPSVGPAKAELPVYEAKVADKTAIKTIAESASVAKLSAPTVVTENAAEGARVIATVVASVTPSKAEGVLQQRLEVTESWLKQQPENTASIQLMGSSNEAQLMQHLNYLATRLNVENIYAYRTQVNKRPFVTILYGGFSSRREALAAIDKLPEDIKMNQPQIRTVGGILKEISKFP